MIAPHETDQRGAEAPAEREHAVLVDSDERDRAGIFTGGFQRAAEIGAVDEEIETGEGENRNQCADQLRLRQEDAADRNGFAAEP